MFPILCGTGKQINVYFLSPKVCKHSGETDQYITDFQEGKITEEKIHRCLESFVSPDYDNDDAISQQSYHINKEKCHKKKHLEIGNIREPKKNKFHY